MAGRIRAFDWAATPLGPSERWPGELRTMVQAVLELPQPGAVCWGAGAHVLYNDAYRDILRERHPHALGLPLIEAWAELGKVVAPAVAGVMRGEPQAWRNVKFELADAAAGTRQAWFTASWAPVRVADGTVAGFQIVAAEATLDREARMRLERSVAALQEARDEQAVLLGELQHRVRNILAVIRSVFSRTVSRAIDLEDAADHFRGRLDSLARTHVVTTRRPGATVDLEDLIRDELLSVGESDGPNVTIEGADVALPSGIAEQMGLAIHELTTNAIKFGALKFPDAKLKICWRVDLGDGGAPMLHLTWTEQGVPAVPLAPVRQGFGSELILEAMPYRLRADTELTIMGGGIRCTINLPLV